MRKVMRKTKEKMLSLAMLFVLICGCMTGCGSAVKSDSYEMKTQSAADMDYGFGSNGMESMAEYEMEEEAYAEEGSGTGGAAVETTDSTKASVKNANSAQKIIKSYNYSYETEHFDDAYAYLKEQINAYEGYISSSEIEGVNSYREYRVLYLTARIPAESSDAFIGDLGQLGTIVRQSETAEDVTLQYSDTESRITSLETEQKRLNALLEQADSLETIIALEERMTKVRYELESYQSKKKLYDNLINYSTVDIILKEVSYTVEVDDSTFFSRVVSGLESSFRDIAEGLINFAEWFIIKSPYLIVWGIIIFVIVKIIRCIVRKKRDKKNKKKQEKETAIVANSNKQVNANDGQIDKQKEMRS